MFSLIYYDGYGYNFYYTNYGYYEYSVHPKNNKAIEGIMAFLCFTIGATIYILYKWNAYNKEKQEEKIIEQKRS